MKPDIQNRGDINRLVQQFYERLLQDEEFKKIFFDIALVDILEHTDVIVDFWESVLFQTRKYKGNTLEIHLSLHYKYRLNEEHFSQWLNTFYGTIDDHFEGPKAKQAKESALSIASIIQAKINQIDRLRKEINN